MLRLLQVSLTNYLTLGISFPIAALSISNNFSAKIFIAEFTAEFLQKLIDGTLFSQEGILKQVIIRASPEFQLLLPTARAELVQYLHMTREKLLSGKGLTEKILEPTKENENETVAKNTSENGMETQQ